MNNLITNKLEQLKKFTCVVADTGDLDAISRYRPIDATTNPTLILKAAKLPKYRPLLQEAIAWSHKQGGSDKEQITNSVEKIVVGIGGEILKIIPGRVSTEVDARLSFDTKATIKNARHIVDLYQEIGISPDRLLIKIASTWEGIQAARILEKEGVKCNLTLLFSFSQAAACADAGVYLISPFVGRILDWYKNNKGVENYSKEDDPGVRSVVKIFNYYKHNKYETIVMGASFRNMEQIEQLAGCDQLTISPELLEKLKVSKGDIELKLDENNLVTHLSPIRNEEKEFRWSLNEDAMATEKLSEGIRGFANDQLRLEEYIKKTQAM
jgi:transaldolase